MRESKKVEVGGVSYLINPMNPLKANRIMVKLVKLLGPTIANLLMHLIKGEKKNIKEAIDADLGDFTKGNLDDVVKGIIDLTARLDEDDVERMILQLLEPKFVIPDGKKYVNMETHFSEFGLFHMYKVVFEVLKVNFQDFLGGLVGSDA